VPAPQFVQVLKPDVAAMVPGVQTLQPVLPVNGWTEPGEHRVHEPCADALV